MTYEEMLEDMCMNCNSYPCKALRCQDHCYSYKKLNELVDKEQKYRWHDLRKNPNDLPQVDKRVYIAVQMEGYISYIVGYYTVSYTDLKTLEWESDDFYHVQNCIAWREIEPFEVDV